jgi:hypothetical protein
MLEVRKKMTRVAARVDTENRNVAGRSLLDIKRNLAKIIRAEIQSVRIISGADI